MVPMAWFHESFVWSPRARDGETLAELRVSGWVLCYEAAVPKFLLGGGRDVIYRSR